MSALTKRLAALERARPAVTARWHRVRRYESESEADAIAGYEAWNGSIGNGNFIMRVIIGSPGGTAGQ